MFAFRQLVAFVSYFCKAVARALMIVSSTKSYCTASSSELGKDLQIALVGFGIQYKARVTSLGTPMGAGTRRNATVMCARLKAIKRRIPRFRKLANNGVSTKRLLRTGGTSALTYGQAVTGVAPSTLLAQRRAAANIAAPRSGCSGQDLDMALMLADESQKGRADPAFEAHLQPIGSWARAVWHKWMPHSAMQQMIVSANAKLTAAKSIWQHVRGPATPR